MTEREQQQRQFLRHKAEQTEAEGHFLNDVAEHVMEIELDQGLHRSIKFARPGSSNRYFRLVTWPGHLCISGDMGDYVFCRLSDMFEFFRPRPESLKRSPLPINLGYWAEKLQAEDSSAAGFRTRRGMSFSQVQFKANIRNYIDRFDFADPVDKAEVWSEVKDLIFDKLDDTGAAAKAEAYDYHHAASGFRFVDLWDSSDDDYSHHFTWCCRAISWGIQRYDGARLAARPPTRQPSCALAQAVPA